jgi:hypothetical protein
MAEACCEERRNLGHAFIAAVLAVSAANPDEREAARAVERAAVTALNEHINQHGCKN